ncbi:hypothetical protein BS17DRAFT_767893 [Gyrodon lividus]|nr:hypothetical protein BS17DRAFT_767893 [Gyrodon lividus]
MYPNIKFWKWGDWVKWSESAEYQLKASHGIVPYLEEHITIKSYPSWKRSHLGNSNSDSKKNIINNNKSKHESKNGVKDENDGDSSSGSNTKTQKWKLSNQKSKVLAKKEKTAKAEVFMGNKEEKNRGSTKDKSANAGKDTWLEQDISIEEAADGPRSSMAADNMLCQLYFITCCCQSQYAWAPPLPHSPPKALGGQQQERVQKEAKKPKGKMCIPGEQCGWNLCTQDDFECFWWGILSAQQCQAYDNEAKEYLTKKAWVDKAISDGKMH